MRGTSLQARPPLTRPSGTLSPLARGEGKTRPHVPFSPSFTRPLRKNSTAGEKFGFGPVIWVRWPGEPSLARLPGVRIVMVRA